ncbi:MAG: Mfa1 fimbrilin C-terminal domain-containing protein [Clostridia bacterium]|nr:Mfa1 fimbrilin C-terminal domain-containing protein [Clostridia bacterium]
MDDVTLTHGNDGNVNFILKAEDDDENVIVYYAYNSEDEEYEPLNTYDADEEEYLPLTGDDLLVYATDGVGYVGGEMYYNIPIQHLNNDYAVDSDGDIVPKEANYGVVRNHHYVVDIQSLENVGKGIYDPNEVIVPNPEDKYYYVGARINIVSWKVVEQTVGL